MNKRTRIKAQSALVRALVVLILGFGCAHSDPAQKSSEACKQRRAAFDLGSGSIKLVVADVDLCRQKILNILADPAEKVDFKEDLQSSLEGFFSAQVREAGTTALGSLKSVALALGVPEGNFSGVATSAFRDARNGVLYAAQLSSRLGINIHIISQSEEGILGYYAALGTYEGSPANLIVWDIGGGSFQLTTRLSEGFEVFQSNLASLSFKNLILSQIQKSKQNSPNPISQVQATQAEELAAVYKHPGLNLRVLEKLKSTGGRVVGIGGVHGKSVAKQLGDHSQNYTREKLREALRRRLGLSDAELGGEYAATDVTNLILVSGLMKSLGIEQVSIADVNNAHGVLLNPKYWQGN